MELQHGGDVYTEGLLKGRKLIDFSSNINPLGIPESFTSHIEEAVKNLNRYPDAKYRELKSNLKEYINKSFILFSDGKEQEFTEEEHIIVGNGAAEVIDAVISQFESILITAPSFGEYEEDALKWGLNIRYSKLTESMEYNYEDMMTKLPNVDALIIGNPNNPNGSIINKEQFKEILDFSEESGKKVIIDEAFIEFVGDMHQSFVDEIRNYKCLFIVRALTKFYAMPGIRLGFGLCRDTKFIEEMKSKQNPWNINSFAEVAAKYVLKDKAYIQRSLNWIKEERSYLAKELKNITFIDKVYETHGNFILCKLKSINCYKFYDMCLEKDIVVRKCDNYKGLGKEYVRFAVKDRDTNYMLIEAIKNLNIDEVCKNEIS